MKEGKLILKTITGSHLYGTENQNSDLDFQGIFIPHKQYVYGLKRCEQVIVKEENDGQVIDYTCFSLPKFVFLAAQNNPNILSLFFSPENRIVECNYFGEKLLGVKTMFLSTKIYHTFRGYAHAQKQKLLTKNPQGKRLEMLEKYGYDVKFAMHLIRLLYEALELLLSHQITYPSPHRKLFKEIRNGEKTLDWVFAEAERIEVLVDEAYVKTTLPRTPNMKTIEDLQMELLEMHWRQP